MKKMIPLVVGNWKMNPQSVKVASRLATEVKKGIARVSGVQTVLAPPFVYIPEIQKVLNGGRTFLIGAQDAHWDKLGAHTGETSPVMLKDLGVTYIILGHSERRAEGETDEQVNKKVKTTLKQGFTAIVCVGEKERDEAGRYLNGIEKQVRAACAGVPKNKLSQMIIAYEPLWAIGSGNVVAPEEAHEMKLFIQKTLADLYGRTIAEKTAVLYGGSVNGRNAEALVTEGRVDGLLVGGASISASEFIKIVKAVS